MSHPFGDLVSQHLHRNHGLSQAKLAGGILQAPTIITAMCKGRRLTGPQARERVVAIIGWLRQQNALDTLDEANALLNAADMASLNALRPDEVALIEALRPTKGGHAAQPSTAVSQRQDSLPAPTTTLIGREKDVAAAGKLLSRSGVRAITLIGPPGVGKTRLAVQVAMDARDDFADGVFFVALASINDPHLVPAAIAQALGLSPDLSPLEHVKLHLRGKHLLLVLDNFEQLLNEGERSAVSCVAAVLTAAPQVKVIVTSRTTLHLNGEHTNDVMPLAEQPAVELFVQRAKAIKPAFTLTETNRNVVAEICCKRLDGLPLAIELAAVRIRLFEPAVLLARLSSRLDFLTNGASDRPARQRTLRNTIDWSYRLLTPEEQMLFRRLGVFAGGCTLDAIEQVAGEGLKTPVVDLMQSLADHSLVKIEAQDGGPRFSLLEMLREYAVERLEQSAELETLKRRHADYFATYAESVEPVTGFQESVGWVERLERERDNLAAAFAQVHRVDDARLLTRFIAAARPLLERLSDEDGWRWLPDFLNRPEARTEPFRHAKALHGAAELAQYFVTDSSQLSTLFQRAAHAFESLGETGWQAASLAGLSNAAWAQNMNLLADHYGKQSARLFEQAGEQTRAAFALTQVAASQRDQGNFAEAEYLFKRCLKMFQDADDPNGPGNVVNGLGDLEFGRGDYEAALVYYDQAEEMWHGTLPGLARLPLRGKGRIACAQGRTLEALDLFETCVAASRQWWSNILSVVLHHFAFVRHLLGDGARAQALLHEVLPLQHRLMRRSYIAESLERCAWIAADHRLFHRAARLFGAAAGIRESIGAPLPMGDRPLHDPRLQAVKAALDETTFTALWNEGQAITMEQAVAYALSQT